MGTALCVAVVGLGLVVPSALAAPSLQGEKLNGDGNYQVACDGPNKLSYTVSGSASGPYPGTFTETGSADSGTGTFTANFTIKSGSTTITGAKGNISPSVNASCAGSGLVSFFNYSATWTQTTGNALIAVRGSYADKGSGGVQGGDPPNVFAENYVSQPQATVVKCELVLLGSVVIPIQLNVCPQ
jgi:hypothetical protein